MVIKLLPALFLASTTAVFLNCQSTRVLTQGVLPFHYSSITMGAFGFCPPIVTESTIFYDNRYTDQNYHSVDTKRTEGAFFRDLKYVVRDKKLAWVELSDSLAFLLHGAFSFSRAPIDSLPPFIRNKLISARIDYVFLVYDLRLSHTQLVGTAGAADSAGAISYGSSIHRELSYKCSIVNVAENKSVYYKEINRKENGTGLDLLEKSIRTLFNEILKP